MATGTQLTLSAGESVLLELGRQKLTLTTHRVRLDESASGGSRLISMTLSSVASCGIVAKSYPLLVVLAGMLFTAALATLSLASDKDRSMSIPFFLCSAASLLAFAVSRKAVLAIASAGEAITVPVAGSGREPLLQFVDALERAKLARESALALQQPERGQRGSGAARASG